MAWLCSFCRTTKVETCDDPENMTKRPNRNGDVKVPEGTFKFDVAKEEGKVTTGSKTSTTVVNEDSLSQFKPPSTTFSAETTGSYRDSSDEHIKLAFGTHTHSRPDNTSDQYWPQKTFDVEYSSSKTRARHFLKGWTVDGSLSRGKFGRVQIISFRNSSQSCVLKTRRAEKSHEEVSILSECQGVFVMEMLYSVLRQGLRYMFYKPYVFGDLAKWLAMDSGRDTFDEKVSVWVAAYLYAAIDFVHARNILHLGITPEHILIDDNGCPILGGFGNATRLANIKEHQEVNLSNEVYFPPETLDGKQPNKMTDLWAIVCCFYEIVKGNAPVFKSLRRETGTDKRTSCGISIDVCGLSAPACSFLSKEFNLHRENRLGYHGGAPAVVQHCLFDEVDWNATRSGYRHGNSPLLRAMKLISAKTSDDEESDDQSDSDMTSSSSSPSSEDSIRTTKAHRITRPRRKRRPRQTTSPESREHEDGDGYLADVDSELSHSSPARL